MKRMIIYFIGFAIMSAFGAETTPIKCTACKGTGEVTTWVTCSICKGRGRIGYRNCACTINLSGKRGKEMKTTICKVCMGDGEIVKTNMRVTPKMPKSYTLIQNGLFGFKFGEVATNKLFAMSKPWRGKYSEIELRDLNRHNQFRLVRVIWNFDPTVGRPSTDELRREVRSLCEIFNVKYGFDIKPSYPATYYHSNDGDWYVGISYNDNNRLFFDIAYKKITNDLDEDIKLDGIDEL